MLTEFERRLAVAIGNRLATPFGGRVTVAPELAAGAGPTIQIATQLAEPISEDFGSVRREIVPDSPQLRRIVRLRCELELTITPAANEDRGQQLLAVDRLLFLLDDGEFRDGTALAASGDQGFVIEELIVTGTTSAIVSITATGWFWPVGLSGVDGPSIETISIREAVLPISLSVHDRRIIANGPTTDLGLTVGTAGLSLVDGDTDPAPFGSLALALVGEGGQPGEGTLTGGSAGPEGRRVVAVVDGSTSVTYDPPASPVREHLVVSMFIVDGDGAERVGMELTRFPLVVEAAP